MCRAKSKHSFVNRTGFTLIELLVVIAIIALLIAILMPSLSAARVHGQKTYCLNNLKEIMRAAQMYLSEQDDVGGAVFHPAANKWLSPGKYRLPWHLGFGAPSNGANLVSEFIYGGFMAPKQSIIFQGYTADCYVVPTEKRPFNRFLVPELVNVNNNRGLTIGWYIDPGDRTNTAPLVGSTMDPLEEESLRSWEANGNSYPINWYWLESPPWGPGSSIYGDYPTPPPPFKYGLAGEQMLRKKMDSSAASRFPLFYENVFNSYMYNARPRSGQNGQSLFQRRIYGWHREFSKFSMAFLDGHAAYIYADTRYTDGIDYNTWAEPGTPRGW